MISVWTADIADEHQLLGAILSGLLRHPTLPDDVLKGSLTAQPFPIQAWIAQPERMPSSWDFWGHLEHRMKSGLCYVVTSAFEPVVAQSVQVVEQTVNNVHNTVKRN
jgi:hypothetical protein